jgi:hypothetical protein
MMGIMQEFYSYLTDDSMTNDQAIARIKEDHGESWAEYVRDEIETEEARYETIG